ncbi:MAG: rhomboid family intramembrane serine protease [Planctomycetes bacterium]|nr:rhomboid family intramembrane serine protease [Planctomycetota bacterium]
MLLIIPIKTDSPVRRAPYVNFTLIAINVLVFFVTDVLGRFAGDGFGEAIKFRYHLNPANLSLSQFFTYQFLHGDIMHLLGNMLFLWIFGNSVNSKMGHIPYLLFYLSAGVFAGVGFALTSLNPCIGASGAIAGVTTAFLVLYPHSEITLFYWVWFYIGKWHIRAMILIVVKIILWDNILSPGLSGGFEHAMVAYEAHIAGYLYGFVVCFGLLMIRALPRDQYDIVALAKRYRQRTQLRAALSDPEARARAVYGRVAAMPAENANEVPISPEEVELQKMRAAVAELIAKGDFAGAVNAYDALMARDPAQVLSRQNILAIANQLMTAGQYPQAAVAYEKYLKTYPKDGESPRIKLMLGIIYAKYLQQNETAEPFLRESAESLTDPDQRAQASMWLESVLTAMGRGGPSVA